MQVAVEQRIEQVHDGTHYKGYIKIAEVQFDFDLKFAIPIPELEDSSEEAKDEEELRRLFQISLKKNDVDIELSKDEYGFFFFVLVEFAIDFHDNPQTRNLQKGNDIVSKTLRGEGFLVNMGGSASISYERGLTFDFPPLMCAMLSDPKFGCGLTS